MWAGMAGEEGATRRLHSERGAPEKRTCRRWSWRRGWLDQGCRQPGRERTSERRVVGDWSTGAELRPKERERKQELHIDCLTDARPIAGRVCGTLGVKRGRALSNVSERVAGPCRGHQCWSPNFNRVYFRICVWEKWIACVMRGMNE